MTYRNNYKMSEAAREWFRERYRMEPGTSVPPADEVARGKNREKLIKFSRILRSSDIGSIIFFHAPSEEFILYVLKGQGSMAAEILRKHGMMENPSPWKWIARKTIRADKGPLTPREIAFYRRHRPEYEAFFKRHRIRPRVEIDGAVEYMTAGRTLKYRENPLTSGEVSAILDHTLLKIEMAKDMFEVAEKTRNLDYRNQGMRFLTQAERDLTIITIHMDKKMPYWYRKRYSDKLRYLSRQILMLKGRGAAMSY